MHPCTISFNGAALWFFPFNLRSLPVVLFSDAVKTFALRYRCTFFRGFDFEPFVPIVYWANPTFFHRWIWFTHPFLFCLLKVTPTEVCFSFYVFRLFFSTFRCFFSLLTQYSFEGYLFKLAFPALLSWSTLAILTGLIVIY